MTLAEVVAKQGELLLVRREGEGAVYNTLTDELSDWLDLQIWFKFGVYKEIDPYPFEGAIEKGGPGSGYHGHSGRPGQRGGSGGGGGVAFGRGATELRQANAVKVLAKLPRSHTAHIKEIEFLTYDELQKKRGGAVATAMGNHHADEAGSEIELKVPPNDNEVFAGNLTSATQQSMLTHEVGHSVHSLIAPASYGLDGSHPQLVESAKRVFGSEDRSALNTRIDGLYASKDRQALNDYAEASTAEYFSESYSHYAHFPQLLKSRDPAMHSFMRDEIFGDEN